MSVGNRGVCIAADCSEAKAASAAVFFFFFFRAAVVSRTTMCNLRISISVSISRPRLSGPEHKSMLVCVSFLCSHSTLCSEHDM